MCYKRSWATFEWGLAVCHLNTVVLLVLHSNTIQLMCCRFQTMSQLSAEEMLAKLGVEYTSVSPENPPAMSGKNTSRSKGSVPFLTRRANPWLPLSSLLHCWEWMRRILLLLPIIWVRRRRILHCPFLNHMWFIFLKVGPFLCSRPFDPKKLYGINIKVYALPSGLLRTIRKVENAGKFDAAKAEIQKTNILWEEGESTKDEILQFQQQFHH